MRRSDSSAWRASEYARLDLQRFVETAHCVAVHFFSKIRAAQIVVRKVARFVAARFRGALQPGNRFLEAAQLDQVRTNVVVRIAKLGINLDGALAFHNRVIHAPLEMVRPAQKRVGFRRGMQFQRRLIELHGSIVVAFHLRLVSVL